MGLEPTTSTLRTFSGRSCDRLKRADPLEACGTGYWVVLASSQRFRASRGLAAAWGGGVSRAAGGRQCLEMSLEPPRADRQFCAASAGEGGYLSEPPMSIAS